MRTKEAIRIELIAASNHIQEGNIPQYKEWEKRGDGMPYEHGYTAGFQEGMDMTMKAMDTWAKDVSIDYAHWILGRMFPYMVNRGAPNPESQKLFDLYQQEKSSLK